LIKERKCPACNNKMKLLQVVEWGVSKKFDKYWQCRQRGCKLKTTEKGVIE